MAFLKNEYEMNNNKDNGKGQQKVVTRARLQEYVNWLNQTNGGSYLKVSGTQIGTTLTISSILKNAEGDITSDGETGIGTIHWERTDSGSTPSVTAGTGSITVTSSGRMFPMGKFWLEYDGKQYTVLDNSFNKDDIDQRDLPNINISGYTQMTFNETSGNTDPDYCVTYDDLINSTYTRYFNSTTMTDGLLVNSYSVNNGHNNYSGNQLVVEKDVNYGKLTHNLEISHITLEIDAMTDMEEYQNGYIPYADNEIKFADVNDVKYNSDGVKTSSEPVTDFTLSQTITDNGGTTIKNYTGVTLSKDSSVAKAAISGNNYQVTVYYYSDEFTLTSTTISTPIGTAKTEKITGSTALANSSTQRIINVSISTTGALTFDIKQRPEIYGYFPVDVYKNSIDENGNVELSARTEFILASSNLGSTTSYTNAKATSVGWLDNAGDNFGDHAITGSKVKLEESDVSAYEATMVEQGVADKTVCGNDVYNTNNIVYDRGVGVGSYHMAYANDAYGSMSNTGGLKGTINMFCKNGEMVGGSPSYRCSNEYLEYTYDEFDSEYLYPMNYQRIYRKYCHSYGRTSILRRFQKINDTLRDTAVSEYPSFPSQISGIVTGTKFPKHIKAKEISMTLTYDWSNIGQIKSGTHNLSGWTTVFETAVTNSDGSSVTTSAPTTRNVYVFGASNAIHCQKNTSQTLDYKNIAPKFYMVDAESCSGATSSGYDFQRPDQITDTTNGVSETRYYKLDYNDYLTNYTNTQKKMVPMVSYNNINEDSGAMVVGSNRYGIYNKYIRSSCAPSAPFKKVSWVDSYAPGSGIDVLTGREMSFIGSDNRLVGSIGGSSNGVIPAAASPWTDLDENLNGIGQDDINKFSSASSTNNFAGQTYYNSGATANTSSHCLQESISFATDRGVNYSSAIPSQMGYDIYQTQFGTTPLRAVSSSTDGFVDGVYTAGTYVYYSVGSNKSVTMKSYTDNSSYQFKFLPFKSKYDTNNNFALRPCEGYVTTPCWTAELNFIIRNPFGSMDNPISDFDMAVYVNSVKLTTSGRTANGVFYQLFTTSGSTSLVEVRNSAGLKQGIYGFLTKSGDSVHDSEGSGTSQKMILYLLFVDTHDITTHEVTISCNANGQAISQYRTDMNTQGLAWRLDANKTNAVGASVLANLGYNGWGSYKNNNDASDTSNGPIMIGGIKINSITDTFMGENNGIFEFSTFLSSNMYPRATKTNDQRFRNCYW